MMASSVVPKKTRERTPSLPSSTGTLTTSALSFPPVNRKIIKTFSTVKHYTELWDRCPSGHRDNTCKSIVLETHMPHSALRIRKVVKDGVRQD